jgi:gliding motility-associated-like protein
MPNGTLTGSNQSATQGALFVPMPRQPGRYFLFTVDAYEDSLKGGLHYSKINMALHGGLGDVELPNSVQVPLPNGMLPAEKLTAVLHANGYDYWIIVHGSLDDTYYSFLLTSAGLTTSPLVSHAGHKYITLSRDAPYTMKASPNGRFLASCTQDYLDILNFDNATGLAKFEKQIQLSIPYGLEFSSDNSKLYAAGKVITQIDLTNSYSLFSIEPRGLDLGMQRGPDGRIYITRRYNYGMAVINQPNAAGAACDFQPICPPLAAVHNTQGIVNFPNFFYNPLKISGALVSCTNQLVALAANPALSTMAYSWDFGDGTPITTGPTLTHRYSQPGRYTVTLTAKMLGGSGSTTTTQQVVTVTLTPTLHLEPREPLVCGQHVVLHADAQPPGTTYHWQDGSTLPTYNVQASGHFRLTVISPGGCSASDSVDVVVAPALELHLASVPPLCPGAQPVVLRPNQQPAGTLYRWQDGSTNPLYLATKPGRYRLEVRSPAGCVARDSVDVRASLAASDCPPVLIPNIITPNGDNVNQCFVLQGLIASDWQVIIFNRWGKEVYRKVHYDNAWSAEQLPGGLYFYRLINPDTGGHYQGWVEVMR